MLNINKLWLSHEISKKFESNSKINKEYLNTEFSFYTNRQKKYSDYIQRTSIKNHNNNHRFIKLSLSKEDIRSKIHDENKTNNS